MIDPTSASLLPDHYKDAETTLTKIISARPLEAASPTEQSFMSDPVVRISKGFNVRNWQADASEDVLQITVKSKDLLDSNKADSVGKMIFKALNEIEAIKSEAILTSPSEYLEQGRKQLAEFLRLAKEEGIRGSEIDYSQSVIFNPNFSRNQQQKYATQVIDNGDSVSLRINIPTNPDDKDKAAALAKKVEEDINRRLPEIKEQMIARLKRKNYIPNLTPEMEQHMQDHEFRVNVNQQGNWTSVFINIRSPEQIQKRDHPETKVEPEALRSSNMLTKIPDANSRMKLAARALMFEGSMLSKPASFFMDVAGTEDMKNGLGKMLWYLGKKRPELMDKLTAFTKENFFKSPEQWNLPPEKQEKYKQNARASIDPDHPDEMKIRLSVGKGKADEIVKSIAALETVKAPPILQMLVDKKALTPEQQQAALAHSKEQHMLSGQAAVTLGGVTQAVVDETLKEQAQLRGQAIEPSCGCNKKDKTAENIAQTIIAKVAQGATGWVQKAEAGKTQTTLSM